MFPLLSLLLIPAVFATPLESRRSELVFGGKIVTDHKFPSQILFIRNDVGHFCGGTLLTNRHVLTAAHCIMTMLDDTVTTAYAGALDVEKLNVSSVQASIIKNKVMHPDWDINTVKNDIGIVELATEIEFTDAAQPISISENEEYEKVGNVVYVVGFGATYYREEVPTESQYLRYADLTVFDQLECREAWKNVEATDITETQICTTSKGKSMLPGDSGGPILFEETTSSGSKWRQVGICSFFSQPDFQQLPNVFTRAAKYCDWIAEATGGAHKCDA
ncbi:hypothetical protein L596_017651 [Steinernema carpocapsae]|uniref:Peptidase S1 domain-containing protein n=1 Tax=Steinernema carpocapsae TaxID=34508 RepID=A0A4U5N299_STECR|nr:hypothetical protein L596_017651 [Steinernema carpocapsae]